MRSYLEETGKFEFPRFLPCVVRVCSNFQCLSYSWSFAALCHVGKSGFSHFVFWCWYLLRNKGHDLLACFLKKYQTNKQTNFPTYQTKPPWANWNNLTWCDKNHFTYFVKSELKYLLTKGFFITLWAQFHKSCHFPDDVSGENETGVWNHFFLASTENNINILFSAHIIPCNQQDDLNVGSEKQKAG